MVGQNSSRIALAAGAMGPDGIHLEKTAPHWIGCLLAAAFVTVCIFDPADQIFHAKIWCFLALWAATVVTCAKREEAPLPVGLMAYVVLFAFVPLLSIGWYYITDGSEPFEGFSLLKGYLFDSFAIVLILNRISIVPIVSPLLTLVALAVIVMFITLKLEPSLLGELNLLGDQIGLFSVYTRDYGDGEPLLRAYFITTPLLVISITQYFDRALSRPGAWKKIGYLILTAINIIGMALAGTRNNIIVSLMLPFLLWPLYTRRVVFNYLLSFGILAIAATPFVPYLEVFLDPSEYSNNIKLELLADYSAIFSDPFKLLLGQGLGAYHFWTAKGEAYFITELTYLEMVRNFGLIGTAVMMGLLIVPVLDMFDSRTTSRRRALAVAYLVYLITCISNPNLFASSGMLILSAMLADFFGARDNGSSLSNREAS